MQKSRINSKYLHILPILCKYLWININIWHCLFLLSRSETEFSKSFQKFPRKITPDLAGYGKNFAIGSSRQSIPSQNKPTPPPSSKRPKKQTARPHKKIRVTGTSRENRAFCGGKITKNSRSSNRKRNRRPPPKPTSGTRFMRTLASRDECRIEAKRRKIRPKCRRASKNRLEMPAKALYRTMAQKTDNHKQYYTHIHRRRRITICFIPQKTSKTRQQTTQTIRRYIQKTEKNITGSGKQTTQINIFIPKARQAHKNTSSPQAPETQNATGRNNATLFYPQPIKIKP